MSNLTTLHAARDVALRCLDHLLTIKRPSPSDISAVAWQINGMERLLLALGEDATILTELGDQLTHLATTKPRDDYRPALARLRSDLEAAHG